MIRVGIRELRSRLSRYLKRVRSGEVIEVTDHGETVARIVPASIPEDLARLAREGHLMLPSRSFSRPSRLARAKPGAPPMSDAIAEDRR